MLRSLKQWLEKLEGMIITMHYFDQGKTIEEAREIIPEVVQAIKDAVTVSFLSKQNKFHLFFLAKWFVMIID